MKTRAAFLAATASLLASTKIARATGGLDPDLLPSPPPVRTAAFAAPPGTPLRVRLGAAANPALYRGSVNDGINVVGVEEYLYGVVPLELGHGWPPAALQAQAILARTYALAKRRLGGTYDVVAGEGDQAYGGRPVEAADTNAAVDATAGTILTWSGGPASVFYSSCCGGHTTDASDLWGRAGLPYLRGVADPYCVNAPDYRWSSVVPAASVIAALGPRFAGAGTVRSAGLRLGPDGRAISVTFACDTRTVDVSPVDFRRVAGARLVRSASLRSLVLNGDPQAGGTLLIEGSGRGHGVGMCQWGARGLALAGASASQILAFYFPGTLVHNG